MTDPAFGGGDIWNDVPLFREIQRVLRSSSGPVNWELARQVGIATASSSGEDPAPDPDDLRGFEEAVRVAELQVAGFTGLEPPTDIPTVEAVRRTPRERSPIEANGSIDPTCVLEHDSHTPPVGERHALDERDRLDHTLKERASTQG